MKIVLMVLIGTVLAIPLAVGVYTGDAAKTFSLIVGGLLLIWNVAIKILSPVITFGLLAVVAWPILKDFERHLKTVESISEKLDDMRREIAQLKSELRAKNDGSNDRSAA